MLGMRHQPGLGCADDPLLLPRRDGIGSLVEAAAGLDLDEGEKLTPPRYDIDLALRGAKPAGQNAIALGDQIGRGATLRRETGAEGGDALGRRYPCVVPGVFLTRVPLSSLTRCCPASSSARA